MLLEDEHRKSQGSSFLPKAVLRGKPSGRPPRCARNLKWQISDFKSGII